KLGGGRAADRPGYGLYGRSRMGGSADVELGGASDLDATTLELLVRERLALLQRSEELLQPSLRSVIVVLVVVLVGYARAHRASRQLREPEGLEPHRPEAVDHVLIGRELEEPREREQQHPPLPERRRDVAVARDEAPVDRAPQRVSGDQEALQLLGRV